LNGCETLVRFPMRPSSLPIVVAEPDERHANRTASVLVGMIDTEHSTTSGQTKK